MATTSRAVLLASAAGLAAGLRVSTHANEIIEAALARLEGMWPETGKEMLEDVFSSNPPRDEGRALQQRLLQKFRDHSAFVFAAFGSSVSAGHDNFMNQSWPFELERLLKPTFTELGFDFEMRQRSAGGYGEMPFGAGCLASRAGEGVDALTWEWHMFNDAPCEGHHFLSEAAAMESSPMVFAFADTSIPFKAALRASNGERTCNDVRSEAREDMLRNHDGTFEFPARKWKPNEWYLSEDFVSNAEVEKYSNELEYMHCKGTDANPRFGPSGVHLQRTGVAAPFEQAGHAFYPVSIGDATKRVVNLPWYQAREKAFNVNWHPGPLGHTLIASSMAHFFLTNLKGALAPEVGRLKGPSADNPLVGKPVLAPSDAAPQCGSLRSKQCRTGMLPTAEGTGLAGSRDPDSDDTWEFLTSKQAAEHGTKAVDSRMVYRGTKNSGELKLNFKAPSDGMYVILCGAPCGWTCSGKAGYVSSKSQRWWPDKAPARQNVSDLTFTIDGRGISGEELHDLHDEIFHENAGKFCPGCKNPADVCQPVAKVDAGPHKVGAKVEPRTWEGDGDVFVEIMELLVVG
ncbi:unnamed protein product [Prorocentrum cordatum]|uniref:Uncharacterized protein n=1 Tax=Prorocentrum cordatum TaxID=2364126 RepID=A0ABN9VMM5_9DINO|nr:unnamed protein product [Polarella glacialis]